MFADSQEYGLGVGALPAGFEDLKAAIERGNALIAKGATLGIPVQGAEALDTSYSALVHQSIDATWSSETFTNDMLVLTRKLKTVKASSSRHETVVITDYGDDDINAYLPEGDVAAIEQMYADRRFVDMKYVSVQHRITQAARNAGIVGPPGTTFVKTADLSTITMAGVKSLGKKDERGMWIADSAFNPDEYDGIRAQIVKYGTADVNLHNLKGKPLSLGRIVTDVSGMGEEPNFAQIDSVMVTPRTWGALSAQAAEQHGRVSQNDAGGALYFNNGKLMLRTPGNRQVEIESAELMVHRQKPGGWRGSDVTGRKSGVTPREWTAADIGDTGGAGAGGIDVLPDASSEFTDEWAGTYIYVIKPLYRKGAAKDFKTDGLAAIPVDAGDIVTIEILDSALVGSVTDDNPLLGYEVYRTDRNGLIATAKFLKRVKPNAEGTAGGTLITDDNAVLPGMVDSYALQTDIQAMHDVELMPTARFPLNQVDLRVPVAFARFHAPHVVQPRKQLLYYNVNPTP